MLKGALITGVVVVGTVATVAVLSGEDPVTVIRVVDGDTIDARVDGKEKRIRLLNVDTPEYGRDGAADDCLAEEATAYLQSLLPSGREITLSYDSERTDRYGRDLAGVFVDDTLVNAEIAREGYGVAVQFGGNDRFMPEVSAAEAEAQAQRLGVHGLPDECLVSAQTATTVSEAAPLLAAGLLAMSQADLDLHEEKLLAALTKVEEGGTLASIRVNSRRTPTTVAEQEELNDTAAKIEQRISEIGNAAHRSNERRRRSASVSRMSGSRPSDVQLKRRKRRKRRRLSAVNRNVPPGPPPRPPPQHPGLLPRPAVVETITPAAAPTAATTR